MSLMINSRLSALIEGECFLPYLSSRIEEDIA